MLPQWKLRCLCSIAGGVYAVSHMILKVRLLALAAALRLSQRGLKMRVKRVLVVAALSPRRLEGVLAALVPRIPLAVWEPLPVPQSLLAQNQAQVRTHSLRRLLLVLHQLMARVA